MTVRDIGKSLLGLPVALMNRRRPPAHSMRQDVQINLEYYCFARYFYSVVKFLSIEGYDVKLSAPLSVLYSLSRAGYTRHLLSEGLVSVGGGRGGAHQLGTAESEQKRLVPFDFCKSSNADVYDVPMAQHPNMYSASYWNEPIKMTPKRAAIFIGNCSDGGYARLGDENLFDVIDRHRLFAILQRSQRACAVDSEGGLYRIRDGGIGVIDSALCRIPMGRFRDSVAMFRFFICAPGAFMPICHNIVEALSVGSIPIIQRGYANLMPPGLKDGVNAIVFDSEDCFDESLDRAFALSPRELEEMTESVLTYYNWNLTPKAVVQGILHPKTKIIRVLAGERSIQLYRGRVAECL